jgi:hypothetical protein
MVRVDIVAAGPSAKSANTHGSHLVLAVNRAALVVIHDWIVAGDFCTLRVLRPAPLWTMKNDQPLPAGWSFVRRYDLLPGWTALARPCNWSVQAAIAVAMHEKATDINIWGADAYLRDPAGPEDCSGYAGPDADRTPERWRRERSDLDLSIAWAQSLGATVTIRSP